ncbi:MAG TPA: hypothetical protein VHC20_06400 [Candidatus Paceibacterota bacterium]|nr:hypothetical protein [Candidatus Paceibacterota bacterium]
MKLPSKRRGDVTDQLAAKRLTLFHLVDNLMNRRLHFIEQPSDVDNGKCAVLVQGASYVQRKKASPLQTTELPASADGCSAL